MLEDTTVARLVRHWSDGWNRGDLETIMAPFAAGIAYTLRVTHVGTDSIVIVYDCSRPGARDKPGADLMRVDHLGRVIEWRCHY